MSSISFSSQNHKPSSKPVVVRRVSTLSINSNNMHEKDPGRERLKRHREEVAGRVSIPDKWGKEDLLKDWMDFSSFDSLLAPTGLASARKALMLREEDVVRND
ncbi:hypothetical protein F3Y22_tig00110956pilonHSYRG00079 [Hibiscus syriacus]|uniref:Uncharacterized protein n=1 Tax=Hibiscus syriacus TaxID=106335 RepID=A0A6A2ZAH8_HIBSY|nr:hypothetical protein F3Y22_tig00110956pilonHSYRG00079 [Hibiscus syriacus]